MMKKLTNSIKKTSNKTEVKKFDFIKMLNQMQTDLKVIRELIPAEVDLNKQDRKKMPQIAAGRWPFVEMCLHRMAENPTMIPIDQSKENILELQAIFHLIKEVEQTLAIFQHSFQDLKALKMYECFTAACGGYGLVKLQSKNNSHDALAIYQQLKALLPSRKKTKVLEAAKERYWNNRLIAK